MTVFEQPLNERIRAFMRLQQLFVRLDHHLNGLSRCDIQASIGVLLDAYDLTSRSNLKTEVLKELERHNPPDAKRAEDEEETKVQFQLTRENIQLLRNELHAQPVRSYQQLQNNEFLNSVKQRCGISGTGSTNDLPLYHFWLDRDVIECRNTIIEWMEPYKHLREAIDLILENIRRNGKFQEITAERGFYQSSLRSEKSLQLVRVEIPEHADIFPEISAGIHRITIRFMKYVSANEKPAQSLEDINFRIAFCEL
ncbi:MAG: cell division protein ZapD [Gammaproteobacteria bacterium]|nr:cell division protein ZapD [Gammaproteobacteria bacterium]